MLADTYYTPEILNDNYKFSESGTYCLPPDGAVNQYLEYIDQLPINDPPEVFGMHENSSIAVALNETTALLSTLLTMQPRTGSGAGRSYEAVIEEIAKGTLL